MCEKGHAGTIYMLTDNPFTIELQNSRISCYVCDREGLEIGSTVPKLYKDNIKSCKHDTQGNIWSHGFMRCCLCYKCQIIAYWFIPHKFVCTEHNAIGQLFIQTYKNNPNHGKQSYYIRCADCELRSLPCYILFKESQFVKTNYESQMEFISHCEHIFKKKQCQTFCSVQDVIDCAQTHAIGFLERSAKLEYKIDRCIICGLNKLEVDLSRDMAKICTTCKRVKSKCSCTGQVSYINCIIVCENCNYSVFQCMCAERKLKAVIPQVGK
jgi:hypothetical protein